MTTRERPQASAERQRLWQPTFIFIVIVNFSLFLALYLLLTTLPFYVLDLGGGESAAGVVLGLFTLSALCVRSYKGQAPIAVVRPMPPSLPHLM